MFRRILAWLRGCSGDDEPDTESGERDSRFVPSPLDRSVRYAHGGNDELDREIADVTDRAREFEERR
ncbi:MAG: hypothetical protein V5A62_04495 [Haloarculaceae archaeon]